MWTFRVRGVPKATEGPKKTVALTPRNKASVSGDSPHVPGNGGYPSRQSLIHYIFEILVNACLLRTSRRGNLAIGCKKIPLLAGLIKYPR